MLRHRCFWGLCLGGLFSVMFWSISWSQPDNYIAMSEQKLRKELQRNPTAEEVILDLNLLAIKLYREHQYQRSVVIAEQVLNYAEKNLGINHANTLSIANNLANLYVAQGRYQVAERLYTRTLEGREQVLGKDHPDTLSSANNLAHLHMVQGRYGAAERLYLQAVEGRERTLGKDHSDTLNSVNDIAVLHKSRGRYQAAEPLYLRALEGREQVLGKDHPDTLTSANNLANLYMVQGRYQAAEPLYLRVLKSREQVLGKDHPDTLTSANNLAGLYQAKGRYEEAERLVLQTLKTHERMLGEDHPDTLKSANNLANLYRSQSRYEEAEPLVLQAFKTRERVLGKDHPDTLNSASNLAGLYQAQGRFKEAEPLVLQAFKTRERVLGQDHPDTLTSASNLAGLYQAQGRYKEAEPLALQAFKTRERVLGQDHPDTLISANNLANLYQAQGRLKAAEPLYLRALSSSERILGQNHPASLAIADNAANFFALQTLRFLNANRFQQAIAAADRAWPLYKRRILSPMNICQQFSSEHQQTARPFFIALAHIIDRQMATSERRSSKPLLKRSHEIALYQEKAHEVSQLISYNQVADAISQAAKSFSTDDPVLKKLLQEQKNLCQTWAAASARLAVAQTTGDTTSNQSHTEEMRHLQSLLKSKQMEVRDGFASRLGKGAAYDELTRLSLHPLEETQALLQPHEALFVYMLHDNHHFAWVIRRGQTALYPLAISEHDLDICVEALRGRLDVEYVYPARLPKQHGASDIHMDHSEFDLCKDALRANEQRQVISQAIDVVDIPFPTRIAHLLYQRVLAPAQQMLEGVTHLMLVPDGALQRLPFATLVTAPSSRIASLADYQRVAWLGNRYALTTLPAVASLHALRQTAKPSQAPRPFVGFGDPILRGSCPEPPLPMPEKRSASLNIPLFTKGEFVANVQQVRDLVRLCETRDELLNVAKQLGIDLGDVYLGHKATEIQLKHMNLRQYRIIHFATHTLLPGEIKGQETLARGQGQDAPLAEPAIVLTPPEKGSEQDDGVVLASEILSLNLDADWVVLSACNTAASSRGEAAALPGLVKSFFFAGARALLGSHWYVESTSASALTTTLFNIAKRAPDLGRAAALKCAMAAVRQDAEHPHFAHPMFWAPFVVIGQSGQSAPTIACP